MHALSERQLIEVWERGQGRHPIDQALAILVSAMPDRPLAHLARLSIGERDAALLAVYDQTFGPRFDAIASCVQCHDTLEFSFQVEDVRVSAAACRRDAYRFMGNAYDVQYRLPNSLDLAEIVMQSKHADNLTSARALLLQRCVLTARNADGPVAVANLPARLIEELAAHMQEADPQADMALQATCPACGHGWQMCFDIVTFLWAKIAVRAQQLLREIHLLAQAYGWSESGILDLSAARRCYYLDLVT